MAKPDLWMPLYFGDYLADTMHLSTEQHGAYMLMLMAAWKQGGALPDDDSQLASITRLTIGRWRKIKPVIMAFWTANDGKLTQKRLGEELSKAVRHVDAQSSNGRKGGRGHKAEPKPDESQLKAKSKPNETPSPSPSVLKSKALSANADGAFQKFWATYPNKANKQAALKAFKRLNVDDALLLILTQAVDVQRKSEQWQRGIIPHGSTWLNNRRWEDEGIAAKPVDTSCQRYLPGGEVCGMPGRPHPVYRYSCEHCDRKESEQRQSHEMPAEIREKLGLAKA